MVGWAAASVVDVEADVGKRGVSSLSVSSFLLLL